MLQETPKLNWSYVFETISSNFRPEIETHQHKSFHPEYKSLQSTG